MSDELIPQSIDETVQPEPVTPIVEEAENKPKKTKKVSKPETAPVDDKLTKLTAVVTKILNAYKLRHSEIKNPDFKELDDLINS